MNATVLSFVKCQVFARVAEIAFINKKKFYGSCMALPRDNC